MHALLLVLLSLLIRVSPLADLLPQTQSQPKDQVHPATKDAGAKAADGEITSAEDLLTRLEKADADLRTLQGDIRYDKISGIEGDRQTRWGKLYFEDKGAASPDLRRDRRFAVVFDSLQIGQRLDHEQKIYVFVGTWYIEKTPSQKQFVKRRIVTSAENFDPFRIGQGPFPIPIGQKRDEILARFDAELVTPEASLDDDDLKKLVEGCVQLHLTPKEQFKESERLSDIRLWYKRWKDDQGREWLLPRLAHTVSTGTEDETIVQLINVRPNEAIPQDVLDTGTPQGWNGTIDDAVPVSGSKAEPKPADNR